MTSSLHAPRWSLALAVALAVPCLGAGADFFDPPKDKRAVTAVRATHPPVIDGVLDEPDWQHAGVAEGFVQVEPEQGARAHHATVVRVLFDDDALYVAARLEQPGGWTAFNQRDLRRDFAGNECDSFGVILDPFGDGRNAVSFQVNPWGAQRDMQVLDETLWEDKWDTVWRSATTRDEQGWTVELAIPWKSLRYGPRGTRWGVQFFRRERGVNEDSTWSPFPRVVSAWRMSYAGTLDGLQTPPPSALSLQVRPYGIVRLDHAGDAPLAAAPSLGGEVTWSPTSSTVVDLTVNTDFAETDVDRYVVNLSRFSVFFPERRQFFLESAGVFTTSFPGFIQPFFSRAIGLADDGSPVPILAGLRGVYRTTEQTAGALLVSTLPTATTQGSLFGVARYSYNLGEQSRLGGMLVVREDLERPGQAAQTNLVPVLDGLFRAGPFTLEASGIGSWTRDASGSRLGAATTVGARLQGSWGQAYANLWDVTPDFQARTGFVARNNMFGVGGGGGLDYRPAWLPPAIRSIGPNVDVFSIWSADRLAFEELTVNFAPMWVLFSGGDEAWVNVSRSTEVLTDVFSPVPGVAFKAGSYDYQTVGVAAFTQASRKVSVGGSAVTGTYYSADVLNTEVHGSLQPLPHLQVSASWAYNRFWGTGVVPGGADTHLLLVETRLALNPRLQLIGSFQRDTAANGMVVNARIAWEFLPLSFVYLVYTDTRAAYHGPGSPVPEQKLVAKVTWTWRP